MKFIVGFIYTLITTSLFFQFFYREDMSRLATLVVPLVFFAPLLFLLPRLRTGTWLINALSVLAFCIGFVIVAIPKEINVWPIALVIWLLISVPALLVLNLIRYIYHRKQSSRSA